MKNKVLIYGGTALVLYLLFQKKGGVIKEKASSIGQSIKGSVGNIIPNIVIPTINVSSPASSTISDVSDSDGIITTTEVADPITPDVDNLGGTNNQPNEPIITNSEPSLNLLETDVIKYPTDPLPDDSVIIKTKDTTGGWKPIPDENLESATIIKTPIIVKEALVPVSNEGSSGNNLGTQKFDKILEDSAIKLM